MNHLVRISRRIYLIQRQGSQIVHQGFEAVYRMTIFCSSAVLFLYGTI